MINRKNMDNITGALGASVFLYAKVEAEIKKPSYLGHSRHVDDLQFGK